MKKLLIILSFLPLSVFAQLDRGEFYINGFAAYSIVQSADGGYGIAGSNSDYFCFIKLNKNGGLQWTKQIGGGNYNEAYSMVQCEDGGYVMTGYTQVYGAGGMDVYVVKLNSSGNLQWTRTIGGPDDDWSYSIIQTRDGGYAITGGTKSFGGGVPGLADIWVIKLDSAGNKKWTKTVEGPWGPNDQGWSIVQARDGGYAVTGSTFNTIGGDAFFVFKMDSLGNLKWADVLGADTANGTGYSIIQTNDGGFAATGQTLAYGAGSFDVYVVKLDSLGNLQWTKTIGGPNDDIGNSIIQNNDRGFMISGSTNSFGIGEILYIIKLDSLGNIKWIDTNRIGYVANAVIQTQKDKGYAFIGEANSTSFFLKLDSLGNSCNTMVSSGTIGSGGFITSGGTITNSDSGRVGSGGTVNSGGTVVTVICESTSVPGIMNNENINIYPVPSSGKINVSLTGNGYQAINIYDELGIKINEKILNYHEENSVIEMDLSNCSNGIYIIQALKNTEVLTREIIIQK